jgi:hypothetical protein
MSRTLKILNFQGITTTDLVTPPQLRQKLEDEYIDEPIILMDNEFTNELFNEFLAHLEDR